MKINASKYNTHSFRIGAATSAKEVRISDAHSTDVGKMEKPRLSAIHQDL